MKYLADLYEIFDLIESTNQYITKHHSELAIEILCQNEFNKNLNTSTYEDIISEHFHDYIEDERIFNLKISTIYRILKKYQEKNGSEKVSSNENNNSFIVFLFKCLDKYGREASVLFSCIDLKEMGSEYLNLLINKYSKIFDFITSTQIC